jgi:hypothetical protein
MAWKCPPLHLPNWNNLWKWKEQMSDKLVQEAPYHPGYEDAAMKPAMRNVNAAHVDFGFLRGMISSNPHFMPSNIDMVLERKGQFIFGEWKREGEDMKKGQQILLERLACKHTVLVITGYVDTKPHISLIEKVIPYQNKYLEIGKSVEDLTTYLQNWYNAVEQGKL